MINVLVHLVTLGNCYIIVISLYQHGMIQHKVETHMATIGSLDL